MLSVSINPSKLPGQGLSAGIFTGQVLLQTSGDTVTIPVTVTVGDSVFRQVNPLSFSKVYEGSNPLPQPFTVASTGNNFNFYASIVNGAGGDWLSLTPTPTNSYYGYYTTPSSLSATVNPDVTLAAGTYTAQILIRSTDNTLSSVIPVTLTVASASASSFDELPGDLTFSGQANGKALGSQALPIRNAGAGTLNWVATAYTADSGGWLRLSAGSGVAPSATTVSVNVAKLPGKGLVAGTFTGQVILQSANGMVTVTLADSAFVPVTALSFSKAHQGANPSAQTITIASTDASLNFYASAIAGSGGSFLSISPGPTNTYYGYYSTPSVLTITANPNVNLAAGVYTSEIFIRSSDNTEPLVILSP